MGKEKVGQRGLDIQYSPLKYTYPRGGRERSDCVVDASLKGELVKFEGLEKYSYFSDHSGIVGEGSIGFENILDNPSRLDS